MRAFTASVIALLVLTACHPSEPDYERMRRSTVQVVIETNGNLIGHCSGVITKHGVLTAAHCAKRLGPKGSRTRFLVHFMDGEFVVGTVVASQWDADEEVPGTDLTLLKIPTNSGYPVSRVSCATLPVGTPVYVSGHPGRVRWAVTKSIVISDMHREGATEARWLQTDATTSGGNSGGPIFNTRGKVVGIVSHGQGGGRFAGPTGHNFGQTGSVICEFLEKVSS